MTTFNQKIDMLFQQKSVNIQDIYMANFQSCCQSLKCINKLNVCGRVRYVLYVLVKIYIFDHFFLSTKIRYMHS